MYPKRMDMIDDMDAQLAALLDGKAVNDCMCVDAVLKQSDFETTQRVFFKGTNGAEIGPFIRKVFPGNRGVRELGSAYQALFQAQESGMRLAHLPRIMQVLDVGDELVVVMEHISGDTLRNRIENHPNERAQVALVIAPLLCDAASDLHERLHTAIIHRDITPSNVLCCGEGSFPASIVLIDLGIAREYKPDAAGDTSRFGTMAYAPPEQFGFGQTDARSDVYSIGMTIAFCLLGHDPSAQERECGFNLPGVNPALARVLAKATSFDPAHRYASARELKAAIIAACATGTTPVAPRAEQPMQAAPSSRPSRIPRKLGITWNVLVCALWVALVAFASYRTVIPFDTMSACPIGIRAFVYFGIFVIPAFFLFFLALDKRPLREAMPFLARTSPLMIRIVCLCAGIGSFIVFAAIGLALIAPFT